MKRECFRDSLAAMLSEAQSGSSEKTAVHGLWRWWRSGVSRYCGRLISMKKTYSGGGFELVGLVVV
jgi:hypothetical protein